ncbi:hypothetical protein [Aureimonas sp. AU40]|uniref:hypothetical protein n=1 Tax=Aureimonas sp. AU40 TaxID=1637747 RepID=UPI000784140D|nr:hypothetical protein [Aureimonas sp. AU40]
MKVERNGYLKLRGEDGEELTVRYDNRGDPYREGTTISLDLPERWENISSVFLETREAIELRDLLNKLYPPKVP